MNTDLDEHVLRVLRSAHDFPDLEPLGGMPAILIDPTDPSKFSPEAHAKIEFWQREMARSQ